MTSDMRKTLGAIGPYELLTKTKKFIVSLLSEEQMEIKIDTFCDPSQLPQAIVIGYYILDHIVKYMGGVDNGRSDP